MQEVADMPFHNCGAVYFVTLEGPTQNASHFECIYVVYITSIHYIIIIFNHILVWFTTESAEIIIFICYQDHINMVEEGANENDNSKRKSDQQMDTGYSWIILLGKYLFSCFIRAKTYIS